MIKYILLFSVTLVAIQAIIDIPKKCEKNDDCEKDECCADIIFLGKHCLKHSKKDHLCLLDLKKEDDYYKHACPCEEGTECRVNKVLWFKIPKCQDPNSEPEENDKK